MLSALSPLPGAADTGPLVVSYRARPHAIYFDPKYGGLSSGGLCTVVSAAGSARNSAQGAAWELDGSGGRMGAVFVLTGKAADKLNQPPRQQPKALPFLCPLPPGAELSSCSLAAGGAEVAQHLAGQVLVGAC
ncbi:hypothetical protein KIL84_021457 [Mauremys mutica]|uniref:Uncharacterized protein n=1 Tax=Mauremys mutica TaxID=74926 RepID=A0A9D3X8Y6_9SAUR|nr:hypothetical protein KIL84_021457 [Mauremys mutica]